MKTLKISICAAVLAGLLPAHADTVLINENFDGDYTKSFQYWYDADQHDIATDIREIFVASADNEVKPWWTVRDSDKSTDKSMASYSWFTEPGLSSKWFISKQIPLESTGFVLEFDAQSVCVRDADRLSTLSVYITESLIEPDKLPTVPEAKFENVPAGNDLGGLANDWTHYSVPLDNFSGKEVYINFVNESYDKDIVCIDNVRVYRKDTLAMVVDAPGTFCEGDKYTVNVELTNVSEEPVRNWKVTFADDTKEMSEEGDVMEPGDVRTVEFIVPIKLGETRNYSIVLTADNMPAQRFGGTTSRLAITTHRKLLLEESTGTWCGFCPLGIYNVERMLEDEEFKDNIVPVSVHYPGDNDYMNYFCPDYAQWLANYTGGNVAPSFVLNRKMNRGLTDYDYNFDPDNEFTLAHQVRNLMAEETPLRIKVSGEWNVMGNDTISITAKALVASGRNETEGRYRIGFILKENNVGLDGSSAWVQHNYLSGNPKNPDGYYGWANLPASVRNYRWQEVARSISGFYGMPGSLPNTMEAGVDYEFEHVVMIPETRHYGQTGNVLSGPVKCDYLVLVGFVIDIETGEIMNCDTFAMSDKAEDRYTTKMYYDRYSEIDKVEMDLSDKVTYYDLNGLELKNPRNGMVLRRQGTKTEKVILP